MPRGAAGSSSREDDQDSLQQNADHKVSKRRCVQSACVPCRRRKSKCDGGTPVCATCTAVYKTECHYDVEGESRRSKAGSSAIPSALGTKRDASPIKSFGFENSSNAEVIIRSLQELPVDQSYDLLELIRDDPKRDITTLANLYGKATTLSLGTRLEIRNLEEEFNLLLGHVTNTNAKGKSHSQYSPRLALSPNEFDPYGNRTRKPNAIQAHPGTTWTSVTNDLRFVEKLLSLYHTWSHSFYVLFNWESFHGDFRTGQPENCSSLLVNAICAYASHFTDDPACRTDPANFQTAGDVFFAEAERQLSEDETSNLTTAQALTIMSMRESSAGRDSSGFKYIGRSIRMCVDLGLHLDNGLSSVPGLTEHEIEAGKTTFWGCFTVDTFSSASMGRISQLPRAAITLDKPVLDQSVALAKGYPGAPGYPSDVYTSNLLLHHFALFSELANDNNYMFFTSQERLTGTKILHLYMQYQKWFESLPPMLAEEADSVPAPHVLVFHMLYHSIIISLFRPMLTNDSKDSNLSPRNICIHAANEISRLFRLYRPSNELYVAHLAIPQVLLSACVVHLLCSVDNDNSHQYFIEGVQGLENLHQCHYMGARNFRTLHTLAKTWNLFWPVELSNSDLTPKSYLEKAPQGPISPPKDPRLMAPNRDIIDGSRVRPNVPYLTIGNPHTKQGLPVFGQEGLHLATHSIPARTSIVVPSQHYDPNLVGHTPTQTTFNPAIPSSPYHYNHAASAVPANVSSTPTSPTRDAIAHAYWTAMPKIPGQIPPRANYQHVDPMSAGSMPQPAATDARLPRSNGYKMEQEWRPEEMVGFTPGGTEHVYAAPHDHIDVSYVRRDAGYEAGHAVPYQHPPPHEGHPGPSQDVYGATWWSHANANPNQRH